MEGPKQNGGFIVEYRRAHCKCIGLPRGDSLYHHVSKKIETNYLKYLSLIGNYRHHRGNFRPNQLVASLCRAEASAIFGAGGIDRPDRAIYRSGSAERIAAVSIRKQNYHRAGRLPGAYPGDRRTSR